MNLKKILNPLILRSLAAILFCGFVNIASAAESGAYMSAVALTVKDLEKATAFYSDVFGMKVSRNMKNDSMSENIMKFDSGEGATLVLIQYTDRENVADKSTRIVFYAADPKAIITKGVEMGATIIREPTEAASMKTVIGIMRDPEGYPVEVIKRP